MECLRCEGMWDRVPVRFRAKMEQLATFQGLSPENQPRPESGLDCLIRAIFTRLRIVNLGGLDAVDQPGQELYRGKDETRQNL